MFFWEKFENFCFLKVSKIVLVRESKFNTSSFLVFVIKNKTLLDLNSVQLLFLQTIVSCFFTGLTFFWITANFTFLAIVVSFQKSFTTYILCAASNIPFNIWHTVQIRFIYIFIQAILFINDHSDAGDSIRKLKVRGEQAQSVHGSELCLNFPTANCQFNWTSYSWVEIVARGIKFIRARVRLS